LKRSWHAILFDTSHPGLTRRNRVTRPDVWLTERARGISMVIAGLDPAIDAENLLA